MIISNEDAIIAADKFINYFKNFSNLEDYLRHVKKSVITYSNEIGDPADDFLIWIFIQRKWILILD